jgi:4-amino-4-deoxy-L-arabinose transferase-like glycosyltransferase
MYIACARAIVAGEGYAYLGQPFTIRPPGLSYLIAPVLALRGTDFLALNLLVASFGALAAFLAWRFWRPRLGWSLALCAALTLWLNPGWQRSCTQVMSEMPALALLFAALLLERRGREAGTARGRLACDLLLGVAIAAATYLRTVSVFLIPAVVLARLVLRAPDRSGAARPTWLRTALVRTVPCTAVALLLLLPWQLRNAAVQAEPPADQTFIHSYGTGMFHEDAGDPSSRRLGWDEVLGRFPKRAGEIVETLGSRMEVVLPLRTGQLALGAEWTRARDRGPLVWITALVLLVGAAYGLAKRREPSDFFTWGVLTVVSVYFGFDDRLLMPVYALAFPATLELARDLGTRVAGERPGTTAATLACLVVLAVDVDPRADWDRIERQHRAFLDIAGGAERALAPDARIGAPVSWHYSVYLGRPVWSLQWAAWRARNDGSDPVRALRDVVERYDLNTVVLSPLVPTDLNFMEFFTQPGMEVVSNPPAVVVRLRP